MKAATSLLNDGLKSRIFLVDDHPVVRDGLSEMINHQDDLIVCGEADDAAQALVAIPKLSPDMAIVDISLRGKNGIELIKDLRALSPRLIILVLSTHDESVYAERTLAAGAQGYIRKSEKLKQVLVAIRTVLKGETYLSDQFKNYLGETVAGKLAGASSPLIDLLTDREIEVFELIGHGRRSREIAEILHLSEKTVETYRAHIREKMNLKDATELLQHAIEWTQSIGK